MKVLATKLQLMIKHAEDKQNVETGQLFANKTCGSGLQIQVCS
jgi:hypothetical protein